MFADLWKEPPEWPISLWWLRDIVEERALFPSGLWIVSAFADREWVGSPGFWRGVEVGVSLGLLKDGTLEAIEEAMPRP